MSKKLGFSFYTKLTGVTYNNRQRNITLLKNGKKLKVVREVNNEYDKNAIELFDGDNSIGYIPAETVRKLSAKYDVGSEIEVFVEPYTVNTLETENLSCTVNLPKFVYAPVAKGDVLGTVEYKMGEEIIGRVDLCALVDISAYSAKPDFLTKFKENIKYILINI